MTVADPIDTTSAAFLDIICADPDWVRAEFTQVVSYLMTVSTTTALSPSQASEVPADSRWSGRLTGTAEDSFHHVIRERVRAPPQVWPHGPRS
ncbi:hypothetical protein RN51_00159 [Microbacterium oxydans]|jgi:hypothetical protein|uniref:Uncharacterized protein n=1 Tax=Microbacterium oxydans TaxID=82380 RepID=A0A0F0L038_9MICO|nr:hypothetical protein [Microbacterium oxydans]KJL26517.1 hypothetical protein RN51_00159 [Microbacterium oxydans]